MSRANEQDEDAWYPTRRTELRTEDKMSKSDKKNKAMPKVKRPYAELFKDEAGGFRYRICGANGEPMVTSEGYTKLNDASEGLFALIKVFVKFDKWYAKGDDSWLRNLNETREESPLPTEAELKEALAAVGRTSSDKHGD